MSKNIKRTQERLLKKKSNNEEMKFQLAISAEEQYYQDSNLYLDPIEELHLEEYDSYLDPDWDVDSTGRCYIPEPESFDQDYIDAYEEDDDLYFFEHNSFT